MPDIFSPEGSDIQTPEVKAADLVGEGKKFATLDDLAKGKAEADLFIKQLTDELKGLRESVTKDNNASENLSALQKQIAELKVKLEEKSVEPSPNTKGELTTGQLEAIVASVITKQEQSRTANQNIIQSNDAMVKAFGSQEKAKDALLSRSKELGMTGEELKALAAKSPTAFGQIMGLVSKPNPGLDIQRSNINSAALPVVNGQPKKGSHAHYNQLRKDMGNKAFFADRKLQLEIFEAKKQGLYDQH